MRAVAHYFQKLHDLAVIFSYGKIRISESQVIRGFFFTNFLLGINSDQIFILKKADGSLEILYGGTQVIIK